MRIGSALFLVGLAVGGWLLPTPSVEALSDAQQVLTGGNSGNGAMDRFTGPGTGNQYPDSFPGAGKGEEAAQVRMPIGYLSKLKVSVVTEGTAQLAG